MYRSRYIFRGRPYFDEPNFFYIELEINNTTMDLIPESLQANVRNFEEQAHLYISMSVRQANYLNENTIYSFDGFSIMPETACLYLSFDEYAFDNMILILDESQFEMTELEDMKPRAAKYIAQRGYFSASID